MRDMTILSIRRPSQAMGSDGGAAERSDGRLNRLGGAAIEWGRFARATVWDQIDVVSVMTRDKYDVWYHGMPLTSARACVVRGGGCLWLVCCGSVFVCCRGFLFRDYWAGTFPA
jgi:hypothetical protein